MLKDFIDKNIRFSIKTKLTITYFIMFNIISVFSLSIFLIIFNNTTNYNLSLTSIFFLILVIKFLEIIINTIVSYKISKKALYPVHQMIEEVNKISVNDMERRLDVGGINNEFKDLAKTFNNMIDEVYNSLENQKRFVSDASHELRTPISVIQGYANMLDRWGKQDKDILDESINAIKDEAESMEKLVKTLLFLARGEKNNKIIQKEKFIMGELIDEIIKETKMIDDEHIIQNTKNEYVEILGDRNLIKEAIRIFVDNSIKYTQSGGTISINSFDGEKFIYIVIEDNGIGIEKEDLDKIFQRFYRVDKSRSRESGGFGLGLSIAKYIIDTHDGEIKIYSKINEGTIISIKIPID